MLRGSFLLIYVCMGMFLQSLQATSLLNMIESILHEETPTLSEHVESIVGLSPLEQLAITISVYQQGESLRFENKLDDVKEAINDFIWKNGGYKLLLIECYTAQNDQATRLIGFIQSYSSWLAASLDDDIGKLKELARWSTNDCVEKTSNLCREALPYFKSLCHILSTNGPDQVVRGRFSQVLNKLTEA